MRSADRGTMRQDGDEPTDPRDVRRDRDRAAPWGGALRGDGVATSVEVQLRREFKGLTVRDLVADLGLDEQLPGRVQSALDHIRRGDYRAADEALPGSFGQVLEGPGHRTARTRRRTAFWIVLSALAAAMATATMTLL